MSDSIKISIHFTGDDTIVEFPDENMTLSLSVTQVGSALYRLENIPMAESANYRDIIEAKAINERHLIFKQVKEPSNWDTYEFLLSKDVIESYSVQDILGRILELGGYWEGVFGGVLIICLPPNEPYDPTDDILSALEIHREDIRSQ